MGITQLTRIGLHESAKKNGTAGVVEEVKEDVKANVEAVKVAAKETAKEIKP